ncbi:MAG: zeta toxin family protein [Terriglobales bacterium]
MESKRPEDCLLTKNENQRIFLKEIIPDRFSSASKNTEPEFFALLATPGTGKSRVNQGVREIYFDHRGGSIPLDSDLYKPYHPAYAQLLAEDDRTAAQLVRQDGRRWLARGQTYVKEHKLNALLDWIGSSSDIDEFIGLMEGYREAGFRRSTVVIAAPAALSRLGIVQRFSEQRQESGVGRLTKTENHDASYVGIPETRDKIDELCLAEELYIIRRNGKLLHFNAADANGNWIGEPRTRDVLEEERYRPWSQEESLDFLIQIGELREALGSEWDGYIDEIVDLARPLLVPETEKAIAHGKQLDLKKLTAFPTRSTPPHRPCR